MNNPAYAGMLTTAAVHVSIAAAFGHWSQIPG